MWNKPASQYLAHYHMPRVVNSGSYQRFSNSYFVKSKVKLSPQQAMKVFWIMLRIPHRVGYRLKDGGKVVSLTHQLRSTSQ
jgi:hypothetical protein